MSATFVLALAAIVTADPASSRRISEARILVQDTVDVGRLARAGCALDVITHEEDESGSWLVIQATADKLDRIRASGLRTEVLWEDIGEKFRFETGVDPTDHGAFRDFGHFLTYWELQDTLAAIQVNFPGICTLFSIGRSYQGRELWCLKISDNAGSAEGEPACFYNGATHAREPMGTSCCVIFATGILSGYGVDPLATWLVDNREIFIVPVMNPDGYVYNSDSGGASSNWRKNRQPYPGGIGVDLNRNYGYKWGYDDVGSSPDPASELYRGPAPFSEPAVAAVRDFEAANRFRTEIDLHTYGQYNMYPWAFDYTAPPEQALLQEMVDTFRVNNDYPESRTGQWRYVLYASNGTSIDWEYADTAGKFVTYAFSCELSTGFWRGWDDSVHIRTECGLNLPNLYYLARVAGTFFDPVAVTVADSGSASPDGRLNPGETAGIWCRVRNRAVHPLDSAYEVTARLVSRHDSVAVLDSTAVLPACHRLAETDNRGDPFRVEVARNARPGDTVRFRFEIAWTEDGLDYSQSVDYETTISPPAAVTDHPGASPMRIDIQPNPARDRIRFRLSDRRRIRRLEILTSSGRLLHRAEYRGSRADWSCIDVPAGVYFARLTTDAGAVVARLSVVR